jgi:hypothetical protein
VGLAAGPLPAGLVLALPAGAAQGTTLGQLPLVRRELGVVPCASSDLTSPLVPCCCPCRWLLVDEGRAGLCVSTGVLNPLIPDVLAGMWSSLFSASPAPVQDLKALRDDVRREVQKLQEDIRAEVGAP